MSRGWQKPAAASPHAVPLVREPTRSGHASLWRSLSGRHAIRHRRRFAARTRRCRPRNATVASAVRRYDAGIRRRPSMQGLRIRRAPHHPSVAAQRLHLPAAAGTVPMVRRVSIHPTGRLNRTGDSTTAPGPHPAAAHAAAQRRRWPRPRKPHPTQNRKARPLADRQTPVQAH